GLSQFDAEGVIGLSSPYKGTAERSSATKKPHKKRRNPSSLFSTDFNIHNKLLKVYWNLGCLMCVAFVLR
ncbi:MAG: hypothetical protein IKV02_06590, partial [Clostridia bacterium]|nr:hypothetical protein [Clostridia bacterium]